MLWWGRHDDALSRVVLPWCFRWMWRNQVKIWINREFYCVVWGKYVPNEACRWVGHKISCNWREEGEKIGRPRVRLMAISSRSLGMDSFLCVGMVCKYAKAAWPAIGDSSRIKLQQGVFLWSIEIVWKWSMRRCLMMWWTFVELVNFWTRYRGFLKERLWSQLSLGSGN